MWNKCGEPELKLRHEKSRGLTDAYKAAANSEAARASRTGAATADAPLYRVVSFLSVFESWVLSLRVVGDDLGWSSSSSQGVGETLSHFA